MSFYTFDDSNFDSFDPSRLVYEEGRRDIGQFKVSYFNLKYKNDDGVDSSIKIKTPVLSTPFGINKNQFGKVNLVLNVPKGPMHNFLTKFQNSIKQYICTNIKTFNKSATKAKISTDEFDILSTAFDLLKIAKEDSRYDDTITLDFSSEYDQKSVKFFDKSKVLIKDVSFDESSEDYVSTVVPRYTQLRAVFTINSICMYGESRARKFTIKKSPKQLLIVERPDSEDTCEFSDAPVTDDESEEEGEENWESD